MSLYSIKYLRKQNKFTVSFHSAGMVKNGPKTVQSVDTHIFMEDFER